MQRAPIGLQAHPGRKQLVPERRPPVGQGLVGTNKKGGIMPPFFYPPWF